MKRLFGFILIWLAIGMLIMFFLPNAFIALVLIIVFLILGYNLFISC